MHILHLFVDVIFEYILILRKTIEKHTTKGPPTEWEVGRHGDVIIVPGFSGSWVFHKTIADFLNKKGYRIHVLLSIENNTHTIKYCVQKIKEYVEKNKLNTVIFFAHSKGGLIVRELLNDSTVQKKVVKAFTIATPFAGTLWGYAKIKNLHELSYKSPFTGKKGDSKIINIYPQIDQHVIPNRNLFLEGATNIKLSVNWHTNILESKKTIRVIEKYL